MQTASNQYTQAQVQVNEFIRSVYNWMAIGLALTGVVAYSVASSRFMLQLIFGNSLVFFGLIIAELVLVFTIAGRIQKLQASTATGMFILYAALNGATLSAIFFCHHSVN